MPYNTEIDDRIRQIISDWNHTHHKKMFGGICYFLHGNIFCGVWHDFLILRLGEARAKEALELPHVKPFDITGRSMKGWIMVAEEGFKEQQSLSVWLEQASEFAVGLTSG
ncbi:TfoX/Sxy family protein [candidate division KSB1 bacterium]|nr:TfoX/Sxy family protein [candidate division KSB1 bacterium]